jgi:hypothetical protein
MVQQIVTLCDVCYDDDVSTPAQPHLVAVAGGAWSLELCERHRAELIDPLADVAERLGQVVKNLARGVKGQAAATDKGKPRPLSEPCLICGLAVKNSGALSDHLRRSHGVDGIMGAYGLQCPVCGIEAGSSTALGRHSVTHGGGGAAEAFRMAWEAGDPHGVVATRLEALGIKGLPKRLSAVAS